MSVTAEVVEYVRARVGGTLRGKWKLEKLLGVGGMAAVYAATHRNQNRVAIKMLHSEHSIDQNVRTRFLREGYVANSVDHPGAVRIFDDDIAEDGAAFLVMELLDGEVLMDRAERKGGQLELGEALILIDQLLDVLIAAHEKNILHRDIKPDNLFLTTDGRLKVLDFGIARLREMTGDSQTTGIGTFMGTPSFMAPEQARARWGDVDARSDVWSVGATLFTLLSGRNVHEAETITEQLVLAVTEPAPSLALHRPDLPTPVIELVDKALAFERRDRWQSAREMQEALRKVLTGVEVPDTLSFYPRVSMVSVSAIPRDTDTMAAPIELTSQISEVSAAPAVSTVTTSPDARTRGRRNLALALAAAGIIAAGIAGMLVAQSPGAPSPAPSAVQPAPIPTRQAPEPPAPAAAVAPALQETASAEPAAPLAHPARKGARRTALPKPSATPSAAPAAQPNPFDKRY